MCVMNMNYYDSTFDACGLFQVIFENTGCTGHCSFCFGKVILIGEPNLQIGHCDQICAITFTNMY